MNEIENIMMESITDCSKFFSEMLENRTSITKDFVRLFKENNIKRVYLSGHGSPWDAAVSIKVMLVNILKVDTTCEIPTLFNNYEGFNVGNNYKPEEMVLICPAGTGKTRGPVIAAEKAKKLGIKVVVSSTEQVGRLYNAADVYMDKLAGKEINFPDCKGHLCTLFLYAMCIIDAAYSLNRISEEEYIKYNNVLSSIAEKHSSIIADTKKWYEDNKELLVTANNARIIGYGSNYGTAIEGALKISEGTRIQAAGWELEQYLHGPILSLLPTDLFFVIGSNGIEKDKAKRISKLINDSMCKNTIFICSKEDTVDGVNNLVCDFIEDEIFSCIQYVVVFQVLTTLTAKDRGHSTVNVIPGYEEIDEYLETRFFD